jgi:hypothetical protein
MLILFGPVMTADSNKKFEVLHFILLAQNVSCHRKAQKTSALDVKSEKNKHTKRLNFFHYQCQNKQTSCGNHSDWFVPLMMADSNNKFVLCNIDAFTKYAIITVISNKEAETVTDAIYKEWFSKFSIPAQIHTDGGKERVVLSHPGQCADGRRQWQEVQQQSYKQHGWQAGGLGRRATVWGHSCWSHCQPHPV